MGLPRSAYVQEGQEGVFHCFSRCVRRAFLCGLDPLSLRNFSHRKSWIVERLRYLAAIFAVDVCAYAVMSTHYHSILRTRPDIVAKWSDCEVATRWLTLFPRHRDKKGVPIPPANEEIHNLADRPERIAQLRKRLSSLSWFMGRLNEFIARAANKEDAVKGRFWDGRFKCQVLLDEAAFASAMVYVDLNPIRAGLAETPEESNFTSIQERIRAWQRENLPSSSMPAQTAAQIMPPSSTAGNLPVPENTVDITSLFPDHLPILANPAENWLCPIQSDSEQRGILQITAAEYFDLVDKSGRMMRPDKPGTINPDLAPILLRIGAYPNAWLDTVSRFGSKFRVAVGLPSNLRNFARRLGRRWSHGVASARTTFLPRPPQLA